MDHAATDGWGDDFISTYNVGTTITLVGANTMTFRGISVRCENAVVLMNQSIPPGYAFAVLLKGELDSSNSPEAFAAQHIRAVSRNKRPRTSHLDGAQAATATGADPPHGQRLATDADSDHTGHESTPLGWVTSSCSSSSNLMSSTTGFSTPSRARHKVFCTPFFVGLGLEIEGTRCS